MPVFDDELNDMTQAAIPAVQDVFGIDQYVTEFPYGSGVGTYRTDIAGVSIDPDRLDARVSRIGVGTDIDGSAHWSPLNTRWRYLKTYLSCRRLAAGADNADADAPDYADVIAGDAPADGEITYTAFLEANSYSSKEGNWSWLEDHGFIQAADWREDDYGDLVQPAKVMDVPFHGDQWAFELKPRDWEHALEQARRAPYGQDPAIFEADDDDDDVFTPTRRAHGGYADFAVVIMDAEHAGPAIDHTDEFEKWGVGLASLDRDGLDVYVDPERHDPNQWSRNRLDLNERTLPDDYEP